MNNYLFAEVCNLDDASIGEIQCTKNANDDFCRIIDSKVNNFDC